MRALLALAREVGGRFGAPSLMRPLRGEPLRLGEPRRFA
jgi:hypothetical protein